MYAILCGSSRKNSNTTKVGLAIKRILLESGAHESDIFLPDFTQYDIPFHNGQNLHKDQFSVFQKSVYDAMANSDLIFVISPEYNWFPSAEIINLINQFGNKDFAECWGKKIFATCGTSSGRGGRIPSVQLSYVLNKLVSAMDLSSVVSAKMFESQFTQKALDPAGNSVGNTEYDIGLEKFVHYNQELTKKVLPGLMH
ncbi:MAG: NAD(P)H-dependent oxidoreductase [Bacteroidetes bacterium]|nr:NAD(P)H-dependent oxidoreductase [Bacteroidota bacterium]